MITKIFLLLTVQALCLSSEIPRVGLVWVKDSFKDKLEIKAIQEKEIISKIENQEAKRVIQSFGGSFGISQETLNYERKVGDLFKTVKELDDQALLKEDLGKILKKLFEKIPVPLYSPELERFYLTVALRYWYGHQRIRARKLIQKALYLNPFQETNWEVPDDERVESHLYEMELSALQAKERDPVTCELKVHGSFRDSIWINGFLISKSETRIRRGLYLAVRRSADGSLFEQLIRCEGRKISLTVEGWSPLSRASRLEMALPTNLQSLQEILILEEKSGEVRQWLYQKGKGGVVSQVSLLIPAQLARQDFPQNLFQLTQVPPSQEPKKWYNRVGSFGIVLGLVGVGVLIQKSFESQGRSGGVPLILK